MTPSVYPLLETLRDALGAVPGVVTARIGFEANMTPDDYPMVRIVPSAVRQGDIISMRQVECLVYFGQPIHEFTDGLEALYADLMGMESALIDAAFTASLRVAYTETVLDEDRVDGYKLFALRLSVGG